MLSCDAETQSDCTVEFGDGASGKALIDRCQAQLASQGFVRLPGFLRPEAAAKLAEEALALEPDERVLEVGTGSGYQTAVLAELCANVFTVERLAPLAVRARKILDAQKLFNVAVQIGDGTIGWQAEAPFDAVVVTAGGPDLPRPLLSQLRRGGRLIVPVGRGENQSLVRLRVGASGVEEEVIADCRFVKLLGRYGFAH